MKQLIIERNNANSLDVYVRRKETEYKKLIGHITDDGVLYLNNRFTILSMGILRLIMDLQTIKEINITTDDGRSMFVDVEHINSELEYPFESTTLNLLDYTNKI